MFVQNIIFLFMSDTEDQNRVLENCWVLLEQCYIDNRADRSRGYENSFDKLCEIDSVRSFWRIWKDLPAIA